MLTGISNKGIIFEVIYEAIMVENFQSNKRQQGTDSEILRTAKQNKIIHKKEGG